jgi:hypothetical protein
VTVTLKLPFCVFPAASLTSQLTLVVPTGNVEPDAGEQLGASGPETVSLALAL